MKSKILRKETFEITKSITESYQLIKNDDMYSIICIENNLLSNHQSEEKLMNITSNENKALEVFEFLVKNKVCEGTINDVILDLMC